jgi:hypothetical protein
MRVGVAQTGSRRWTALALLVVAASALAQQSGTQVIEERAAAGATRDWTLAISGEWPTQCPPTLENVALDGNDLRIDARSQLGLCTRRAMPYSIELDPALALQDTVLVPGVYRVSYYAADGAQAEPKLRAFALLDHSAPDAAAIVPESGFWWSANGADASADRTVLSLELQDDQLSAALMSYDNIGQPVWYFGAAPYAGHIAHITLLRLAGGSDPFVNASMVPRGDPVLTLDLQFESGAHALGWLSRERSNADDVSLQIHGLDLVRLPFADAASGQAWQGDWVLVADTEDDTPRRLLFSQYRAVDTQHFELNDGGGNLLVCVRESTQPEWPPSSCSLHGADGALTAAFDSVAMGRMDGVRSDGKTAHLLRVSR